MPSDSCPSQYHLGGGLNPALAHRWHPFASATLQHTQDDVGSLAPLD
jgi:hypothetical protein